MSNCFGFIFANLYLLAAVIGALPKYTRWVMGTSKNYLASSLSELGVRNEGKSG